MTEDEHVHVVRMAELCRTYAKDLREHARSLADTPGEASWWRLRRILFNLERWQRRLAEAMAEMPEQSQNLTTAYLDLAAAKAEAKTVHDGLAPIYLNHAAAGGTVASIGFAGFAPDVSAFPARYAGRCFRCDRPFQRGEAIGYDRNRKVCCKACLGRPGVVDR